MLKIFLVVYLKCERINYDWLIIFLVFVSEGVIY